jgi:hypothetical protein
MKQHALERTGRVALGAALICLGAGASATERPAEHAEESHGAREIGSFQQAASADAVHRNAVQAIETGAAALGDEPPPWAAAVAALVVVAWVAARHRGKD